MIKAARLVFIVLLFHANIILLAHTMIPHHFHSNDVYNEIPQCQTYAEANEHNPADHHHEHDNDSNVEYCDSDQVFVIRSNQAKLDHKYLDFADNQSSFNAVTTNFTNPELINILKTYFYNTHLSSVFSTYCQYISSGPGLRAPPQIVYIFSYLINTRDNPFAA